MTAIIPTPDASYWLSLIVGIADHQDVHLEHFEGKKWRAGSCFDGISWGDIWYTGSTPEAALRKLYQALKKQRLKKL